MEVAQFDADYADAVERSFRDDAIRTAVLIDDQFPSYAQMRQAAAPEFKEIDRAERLYGFLHRRGLICDVENWRKPDDADMDLIDKIRKSDLVVLDYQLGTAGPKTALKILRHLAVSPHFNLVVLYTNDPLSRVALSAAAAMRGLAPPSKQHTPASAVLDDAEEVLARQEFSEIDAEALAAYLTKGETPWQADLRGALQGANIPLKNLRALADHVARTWITDLFSGYQPEAAPTLPLSCSLADENAMWLHSGSCFVAIVGKLPAGTGQDEGDFLWRRLGAALRAWRPNFYRLVLSEIQNALELEAVADHEAWLDDDLCLGLGLYLLESEKAASGELPSIAAEGAAHSLVDRFVDIIRRRLASHGKITGTASTFLAARLATPIGDAVAGENGRHVRARQLAHVDPAAACDWSGAIVPEVNAFMVSDAFRAAHITTGSVLKSGEQDYWLCASPACDLEPREAGPVLLQLIRLMPAGAPAKFTTGEHLAITTEGGVKILKALNADNRQPSLKVVFLPNGTHVGRDGASAPTVRGWFATGSEPEWIDPPNPDVSEPVAERVKPAAAVEVAVDDQQPQVPEPAAKPPEPTVFTVIAQLRSAFATRFLLAAGQHLSRIGVDFIDP
jgi:hypothetical protein